MIPTSQKKQNTKWWEESKNQAHPQVFSFHNFIMNRDYNRQSNFRRFEQLYEATTQYNSVHDWLVENFQTENIIKPIVDQAANGIAKARIIPKVTTIRGNWSMKRKARRMQRFIHTVMKREQVHQKLALTVRDACIYSDGFLKVSHTDHKVCVEKVHPRDIFVDPGDGRNGTEPRQIIQQRFVDRSTLMDLYPDHKDVLKNLTNFSTVPELDHGYDTQLDQIRVLEVWRLPVNGRNGRHVICVESATLLDEEFTQDEHDFIRLPWSPSPTKFWGSGIIHDIWRLQLAINKDWQRINKILRKMATTQVWLDANSRIKNSTRGPQTNKIGAVNYYSGNAPMFVQPPALHGDLLRHIEVLKQTAYEVTGVSQMGSSVPLAAQSGTSGKAIEHLSAIENQRFAMFAQRYEQSITKLARLIVAHGKKLYEQNPDFTMVADDDKHTISELKFKDVDLDKDSYVIDILSSAQFPDTFPGKMSAVEYLINLGVVNTRTAKELLQLPDLSEEMALDRAAAENIERVIEKMLDDGVAEHPEPTDDIQLAIKMVTANLNLAKSEGAPEDRLQLLRDYLKAAVNIQQQKQAANQTTQQQPGQMQTVPNDGSGVDPTAVQQGDGQAL